MTGGEQEVRVMTGGEREQAARAAATGVGATVTTTAPPFIQVNEVSRAFGLSLALSGVSLGVRVGEVVGLVGENGAGKSTLLNIMSGTDRPDRGTIAVRGADVEFRNYSEASRAGVFRVFQELAVVPTLSVWENLFLGYEELIGRAGVVNTRRGRKLAREILRRYDYSWIDVSRRLGELPFPVQQLLEILKAIVVAELLGHEQQSVLLDEPTAALGSDDVDFLREQIRKLRRHSATVLVSHRLAELIEWCDRLVILKDGEVVGERNTDGLEERELHYLMVGRERDEEFYAEGRQRPPDQKIALELRGGGDGRHFTDVDLTVRGGQIVGVAGVLGSGKAELGRAIYTGSYKTGSLAIWGKPMRTRNIAEMVRRGVGYIPPERKVDGIVETMSVRQNLSLAWLTTRKHAPLSLRQESALSGRFVQRLGVKAASDRASILSLSGGNQQKVILARWLAAEVALLIVDNPTRGVDAGAKQEIYSLLRDLTDSGHAILLISDDLLEVIGLSNEIVVMKGGRVTGTIDAPISAKPREADLIEKMV